MNTPQSPFERDSDMQTTPDLVADYKRRFAYTAGAACHSERQPWYRLFRWWFYPLALVGIGLAILFIFLVFALVFQQ